MVDVSVLVSSEEGEFNESVFSHSEWMKLQVSSNGHQHMHPITTRALFQSQTWNQSEEDLSKIFGELFALTGDHLAPDQVLSSPSVSSFLHLTYPAVGSTKLLLVICKNDSKCERG